MNRRRFFGALAALFVAPAVVKPAAPPLAIAFHPKAFSLTVPPIDVAEFQARYIAPAVEALAAEIDSRAVSAYHRVEVG